MEPIRPTPLLTAVYTRRKSKGSTTVDETPSPSNTSKCSTPTKVLCLKNKSPISGSAVVGEVDNKGSSHYCPVSNVVNPSSSSLVATKNEMVYNGKPLSLQFQPGTPSPKKQKRQAKKPTHVFSWPRACHSKKRIAADKFVRVEEGALSSSSTKPPKGSSHYCPVSNIVNPSSSLVTTKNEMVYNGKPLSLQLQPGTPSPKKQKRQAKKPTHVFRWPRACHSKKRIAADKFVRVEEGALSSSSTKSKGPLQIGESNKKGKNVQVDHDDTMLVVSRKRPKRKRAKILNLPMTDIEKEEQRRIYEGLVNSFISCMRHVQGARPFIPWKGSVVDSVIGTFLTQNVSDISSSSAFISLAAKYPNTNLQATEGKGSCSGSGHLKTDMEASSLNHEALRHAEVDEIAEAIIIRGQHYRLAQRIKNFLNKMVEEHRSIDLEWLKDITPDKAKEYLIKIDGFGVKSVECIRLLSLHQTAFPVDTNVARIAVRLGWVPLEQHSENDLLELYPKPTPIQNYLWPMLRNLDQATLYELHYQMITFGKVFCMEKNPNCSACPMKAGCKYYASVASQRSTLPETRGKAVVPPMLPIVAGTTACEPVIEEPTTPKNICMEMVVPDMEDAFDETRHRTKHRAFELPNGHLLLEGRDERLPDDPCPYLLTIQRPVETEESTQPSETCCTWLESGIPCKVGRCLPCMQKEFSDIVHGTLLVPVKTTMRGRFPLSGTHFQVNEVFASTDPIYFPMDWMRNLKRRIIYFGSTMNSIYKDMSREEIKFSFHEGYICVRLFDTNKRITRPLAPKGRPRVTKRRSEQMEEEADVTRLLPTHVMV